MENYNHNLIHQLSEDLDSLWRYDTYTKDAENCKTCQAMWSELRNLDEKRIDIMKKELLAHIQGGIFDK